MRLQWLISCITFQGCIATATLAEFEWARRIVSESYLRAFGADESEAITFDAHYGGPESERRPGFLLVSTRHPTVTVGLSATGAGTRGGRLLVSNLGGRVRILTPEEPSRPVLAVEAPWTRTKFLSEHPERLDELAEQGASTHWLLADVPSVIVYGPSLPDRRSG